ncbi:MAG TPA: aspartate 1-decarboxylase [Thermodesulfovibrionia bacterium]|nr:aspartate 1-decarboxylase [Thermodesulfovibrionia bacterium]
MLTCMLKAKLHRAVVTASDLSYEGSLLIDADLLDAAGILPYEQVRVSNVNNGERFETYVIPGKRGSREFCVNGAAARRAMVGDRIIVFSYVYLTEEELKGFKPKVIVFNESNEIITP